MTTFHSSWYTNWTWLFHNLRGAPYSSSTCVLVHFDDWYTSFLKNSVFYKAFHSSLLLSPWEMSISYTSLKGQLTYLLNVTDSGVQVLHYRTSRIIALGHTKNLMQFSEMLSAENASKQVAGYSACVKIMPNNGGAHKRLKVLCLTSYSLWTPPTVQISYVKTGTSLFQVTTVQNQLTV